MSTRRYYTLRSSGLMVGLGFGLISAAGSIAFGWWGGSRLGERLADKHRRQVVGL